MRHPKSWLALASAAVAVACGGPVEETAQHEATLLEDQIIDDSLVDHTYDPAAAQDEVIDEGFWEGDVAPDWEPPSLIEDPVVRDDVIVVEPYRAQHWGIERDRLTVPIAGNEELLVLEPGWKLISAYLFSRVIESVDRVGDSWVFQTRDAQPTDVILRGSIRFPDGVMAGTWDPETGDRAWFDERDNPFQRDWDPHWRDRLHEPQLGDSSPFGDVRQGAEGGLDVAGPEVGIERTLGQRDVGPIRVESSGSLTIKPLASVNFRPLFRVHLDIDSSWGRPYLKYFEMRAEGTVEWMLGVEVTGTRAVRGTYGFQILGQTGQSEGNPLFNVRCFSTPTVWVSIVPIWADICPKLSFDASAEASMAVQMRATVSGSKTMGGGMRYNDGRGWTRYTVNPPATITRDITMTSSLAFKASAGLTPKAALNLWSLAGPFVSFPFGLEFESKCQPPALNHDLKAFLAANAGIATDPKGAAQFVVPKWQTQMQLFKMTYPIELPAALGPGVCQPGYVQLDYNRMVANANTSRTLELDLVLEIPASGGNAARKISNNGNIRTGAGNLNAYPFAGFARADCAACSEQIAISMPLPGDYKVWAYDYENSNRATNAFSASGAKVTLNFSRPQEIRAPAGTYNKWNVATLRVDANRRITVIPCSSGCTQSVDLVP